MPTEKDTLVRRTAIACGVSEQYVRQVLYDKTLRTSRTQRKVVHHYCNLQEERIHELRASIINEAMNDFN